MKHIDGIDLLTGYFSWALVVITLLFVHIADCFVGAPHNSEYR